MTQREHQEELNRIGRTAARVRIALVMAAAAVVIAVAAAMIGVAALLPEGFVHTPGSWVPLLLSLLAVAASSLVAIAARRLLAAHSDGALVPEVERSVGFRRGELAGALEMDNPDSTAGPASDALRQLGRERVATRLASLEDWQLFPDTLRRAGRRISISGATFLVAFGMLAWLGMRAPDRTLRAAEALGNPWSTAFPPPPPKIRVAPGDTAVLRGDLLPVRAVAPLRDSVNIAWQAEGEPVRRVAVNVLPDGHAAGTTAPIDAPTRFWVEGDDGTRSDEFDVRPLDPLLVTDLAIEVRYPAYLARPTENLGSLTGQLELPIGTVLSLRGRTNAELESAGLRADEDTTATDAEPSVVAFAVDADRFSAEWTPRRDGRWSWALVPEVELPGIRPPPPFEVRVVPDLAPQVAIPYPGRDTVAGVDLRMPLVVDASDDIGLASIDLETWTISVAGLRSENRTVPLWEAPTARDTEGRLVLRPELRLDVLGLVPGDTLFYVARARDANPRRGAARSDTFRVVVPTMSELRRSAAETATDMARGGRELRDDAAELSRAARDAERRSDGGRADPSEQSGADFEATEEARRVLEQGAQLDQRIDEMQGQMDELREGVEESGLADTALREKLDELEDLFRQIEETGLGEQLRQLEEALRNLDGARTQQELGELSSRLRELEERLDQALGLMERVATEQAMKETSETARQVADQQSALAESFEQTESWADEQAAAAEQAEALMERMEALQEQLEQQGLDAAADSVGQGMQQMSEAAGQMQAASDAARQGQSQQGQQGQQGQSQAQQAAAQSSEAAQSMESAGQMLNQDWKTEALEAVSKATGEALDLATEQDALADQMEEAEAGAEELAGRQAALLQGLDRLLESLSEAGRKTALIDEGVGRTATDARERMQALGEQLGERDGPPRGVAGEARSLVESLNDLAGRLMASRAAVENAGSATGMEEALDQLAQMSQSQAGLNRESGGLMLMQQNGQPMAAQLERLAQRQEEIARELEELAERPEAGELQGRPELLAAEADEIARNMRSGRLDESTLRRQEQLFRRLLDAGRSLERDEDPNRRESQAAELTNSSVPDAAEIEAGPRFPYPDDEALSRVSPSARRLILEYFDRLNAGTGEAP